MNIPTVLNEAIASQKYSVLFATISGAHLYGFPSHDSDYDLRGSHILPVAAVVGLDSGDETIEIADIRDGIELDFVSHDIKKFVSLMLKKNGYVLEQLYSPLVVLTTQEHEELKEIGKKCITRNHSHHYFGFSQTQWRLFEKQNPHKVKPLLYVYRVLLTGIYLMQTGVIEANLLKLNEVYKLPYIDDLVHRKLAGDEKEVLTNADMAFHEREFKTLTQRLQEAFESSSLPEVPSAKQELNDLLIRSRLKHIK